MDLELGWKAGKKDFSWAVYKKGLVNSEKGGKEKDAGLPQSNDLSSQRGECRFAVQPYRRLPNSRSKQTQYPSTDR